MKYSEITYKKVSELVLLPEIHVPLRRMTLKGWWIP